MFYLQARSNNGNEHSYSVWYTEQVHCVFSTVSCRHCCVLWMGFIVCVGWWQKGLWLDFKLRYTEYRTRCSIAVPSSEMLWMLIHYLHFLSPLIHAILVLMVVWKIRGKIIRTLHMCCSYSCIRDCFHRFSLGYFVSFVCFCNLWSGCLFCGLFLCFLCI